MPSYAPNALGSTLPLSLLMGARGQSPELDATSRAAAVGGGGVSMGRGPLAGAGGVPGAPSMPAAFRQLDPGNMQLPGLSPEVSAMGRLQPKKKPKFFSKDGLGPILLGAIGDGITNANGGRGTFLPAYLEKQGREREMEFDREKFARELEAKRAERMAPRIEQVGNILGRLDPEQGAFNPFYSAPQPFESYAQARGFQPGTPEYADEVENYRLGSWGDPAMEAKTELEGIRQGNRREITSDRLTVTRRGQDLTHDARTRGQDLDHQDRAAGRRVTERGQDMTDRRGRFSSGFNGKGGQSSDGAVAVNKATGERVILRGGKWVPYQ